MAIINRYIMKELFKIFTISVGFLTMILFLDKILYLTEMIVNKGVTFLEVARMMVYISPAFLALTIPVSVLAASVVVFNQLSSDSEWVAMKANGWSFLRLMRPALYFSLISYTLANLIIFYALPWGNHAFKQLIYDIVRNRANFDIKPNVFNSDFQNLVLLAKDKEGEALLKDVFIADSTASETPKIIVAEEGAIISNPEQLKIQLQLKNGAIHDLSEKRENYQLLNFDRYDLTLDLPNSENMQKRALVGNRELSFRELLERIDELRREGKTTYAEQVEVSKKFSIPFTCLIFGFIGAPLGIKSSRSGKSGSYTIATIVIVVYYAVFISTQNLGSFGKINPLLSVWIPNLLFSAFMFYLLYKMQKEIPFKFFNWAEDTALSIGHYLRNYYYNLLEPEPAPRPPVYSIDRRQRELDEQKKEILKRKMEKINTQ